MATIKQPPANHRNPSKTTSRRAAESKTTSDVKHGVHTNKTQIIGDESAEGLALLTAEYHEQYLPANSAERTLVDTLVNSEWNLRRLRRAEIEIWDQASDKILAEKGPAGVVTAGETFAAASDQFLRHQRTVDSCERNYHRALKELQRLRTAALKSSRRGSVLQFPQSNRRTEPSSSE